MCVWCVVRWNRGHAYAGARTVGRRAQLQRRWHTRRRCQPLMRRVPLRRSSLLWRHQKAGGAATAASAEVTALFPRESSLGARVAHP